MIYEYKTLTDSQLEQLGSTLDESLNKLGKFGWKLISVLQSGCLIFIREKVGATSKEQPKQRFMIDVSTDVEGDDIINRCIDAVSDVLAESGKYFGVGCPMK